MRHFLLGIGIAGVSLIAAVSPVLAQRFEFPDPIGYVNDFAGVLGNDSEIDQTLRSFDEAESTQIVVIVINELPENVTLEEFVPFLTEDYPAWQAGQEEFDNGVIFTVVIDSREMRIDTGYGVEGALPDVTAQIILDYDVKPHFRDGDYDGGVEAGVNSIMDAVKGEYSAEMLDDSSSDDEETFLSVIVVCCPLFMIFVFPYLAAYLGRTKSWWLGGVLGFVAGILISSLITLFGAGLGVARFWSNLCFPPIMGLLGLFFDFILSKNYKVRKQKGLPTGWTSSWGGFSGGGSSFSGGSSGGFSGGGGSFGGGGASSGW